MSYHAIWDDATGGVALTDKEAGAIQGEVRPVFHEELDLLGFDRHWCYPRGAAPLLWAVERRYYYHGRQVAEAKGGGFFETPTIDYRETDLHLDPVDVPAMVAANTQVLEGLAQQAIEFIDRVHHDYKDKVDVTTVAFSGGKDSLVVLDLVQRALPPDEFVVVFGDTTMEISATYEAVRRTRERYPQLTFLTARSQKPASQTWRELGPPSRLQRWCCTVHKSAPTLAALRLHLGRPGVSALVVEGVRHQESQKRAHYDAVAEGGKHGVQVNARPVISWSSAAVHLYLMLNGLLLNDGYRHGLARVGCIVCPFGSDWSETIVWQQYQREAAPFVDLLTINARDGRSETEAKWFVHEGRWKVRAGGRTLANGGNRVVATDDGDTMAFTIQTPAEDWLTWAEPLGRLVRKGDGRGVIIRGELSMQYTVTRHQHAVDIQVSNLGAADRFLRSYLRAVANKAAYCVHCGGCVADCPVGALVVNGAVALTDACVHCARCLGSIERGCLAAKSLQAGEGGSVTKGLDRYCTFGLRKTWLEQYFGAPDSWWSSGKLGPKQFPAMRAWLKEAEVVDGTALTPLGLRLRSLGVSNPLTWAVIWTNLARNSTVANWFVANVPWQEQYTKAQLVERLGDGLGLRTRENAVNALAQLLRETPLGTEMGLAVALSRSHGETTFAKPGWDSPSPVAVLYALYRLAESQGRHAFALREVCSEVHEGPYAVFGTDPSGLATILRGAASRWPEWLRVEFVRDLDSIYLDQSRTALDALSVDA